MTTVLGNSREYHALADITATVVLFDNTTAKCSVEHPFIYCGTPLNDGSSKDARCGCRYRIIDDSSKDKKMRRQISHHLCLLITEDTALSLWMCAIGLVWHICLQKAKMLFL